MLPVALDCPFLMASSVFFNIYFLQVSSKLAQNLYFISDYMIVKLYLAKYNLMQTYCLGVTTFHMMSNGTKVKMKYRDILGKVL
jgi:hypothetical protein